jgi:hypothetical protein
MADFRSDQANKKQENRGQEAFHFEGISSVTALELSSFVNGLLGVN